MSSKCVHGRIETFSMSRGKGPKDQNFVQKVQPSYIDEALMTLDIFCFAVSF